MRVTLPSGCPAEVARPDGDAVGGLVVIPDIFGLRPLFDDLVARMAREHNLVVCAPEMFAGLDLGGDIDARRAAVMSLIDSERLRDFGEAPDATGAERVVAVGFCLGGMYIHKAASLGRFAAMTSFYGMIRVPPDWQSPNQGEPLELLAKPGASKVLAIIGGLDPYTPPADVKELENLGNVTVARYPEAEHGFVHDPARPAHRPDDAADAWRRCWEFLDVSSPE